MGFRQTAQHKNGKGSFHQIGLVRGQFGNVPEAHWVPFLETAGFDGWEEASWELDLRRCDTDAGAAAYAEERVTLAKKHNLEIFTVATHLQGQVLGDEPSAKTLNFCSGKGEAKAAYKAWRAAGNSPPSSCGKERRKGEVMLSVLRTRCAVRCHRHPRRKSMAGKRGAMRESWRAPRENAWLPRESAAAAPAAVLWTPRSISQHRPLCRAR